MCFYLIYSHSGSMKKIVTFSGQNRDVKFKEMEDRTTSPVHAGRNRPQWALDPFTLNLPVTLPWFALCERVVGGCSRLSVLEQGRSEMLTSCIQPN